MYILGKGFSLQIAGVLACKIEREESIQSQSRKLLYNDYNDVYVLYKSYDIPQAPYHNSIAFKGIPLKNPRKIAVLSLNLQLVVTQKTLASISCYTFKTRGERKK